MTIAAIVAAQRKRSERELIAELRAKNALSSAAAIELDPQRRMGRSVLQSLVRHSAVLRTPNGAYWLDEAAYSAWRARRQRLIAQTMTIIFIVAALAIALIFVLARSR